jgi:hypothetical protein
VLKDYMSMKREMTDGRGKQMGHFLARIATGRKDESMLNNFFYVGFTWTMGSGILDMLPLKWFTDRISEIR